MVDRPLSIDIRHPLLLKANDLVLLTREDGEIVQEVPGFGLFYRDTCYLAAYALRLHGTAPLLLMSSDSEGMAAQIALTNIHLSTANGQTIADHKLSLRRTLLVLDDGPTFIDTISVRNFGLDQVMLPISLEFSTTFESMFVLRGAPVGKRGRMHAPEWDEKALRFSYEGADGVLRTLLVDFSPAPMIAPRTTEQSIAWFELSMAPQATQALIVTFRVDERPVGRRPPLSYRSPRSQAATRQTQEAASKALLDGYARLETPSKGFGEALARSLTDVALLEVTRGKHRFTAAGVPWFVGLFGRDSLLPTIQCLAFNPDLGRRTAAALANLQGTRDDAFTNEQPGKILHELRVGELAHLHEVSQTPSYLAVEFNAFVPDCDRAPCRVDRVSRAVRDIEGEHRPRLGLAQPQNGRKRGGLRHIRRADQPGPADQPKLARIPARACCGMTGVTLAPPLALVEVQGYAYQARILVASLLRRRGDEAGADRLEADARRLQARFLRDFWMEEEGCYCLALEEGGRQVTSVTSNAAQVLWTGIATAEHARRTAARMMKPDMFSGWGVRTLSADHPRFDPPCLPGRQRLGF